MKDVKNILKKSVTWKIEFTRAINFFSFRDTDEEHVMHSNSENTEFMIYDNADEVIEELFKSFLNRYQIGLETSMRGSDFVFDCAHFLYYKGHKINPNLHGGSNIDSLN